MRAPLLPLVLLAAALVGCSDSESDPASSAPPASSDTSDVASTPTAPPTTPAASTPSGSAPSRASAPSVTSAPPASNDADNYGVTSVAGESGIQEEVLSRKGEWTIYAGMDATGSDLVYCVAERNVDGNLVRIGTDEGQWQLAVPAGADLESGFEIERGRLPLSGTTANGWTIGWLTLPELEAISESSWLEVMRGEFPVQHDLSTVGEAIAGVESCSVGLHM